MSSLAESISTHNHVAARPVPLAVLDFEKQTAELPRNEPIASTDYRKVVEDATGYPVPEGQDVVLERMTLHQAPHGVQYWYKFKFVTRSLELNADRPSLLELFGWVRKQKPRRNPITGRHGGTAVLNIADLQLGKALADDTPVFTPNGWVKHGDIRPGDYVYAPSGKPVRVLDVTGSALRECYRVVFDKGAEIIASKDHLWSGYRMYRKDSTGKLEPRDLTWTTEQIAAIPRHKNMAGNLATSRSFRIPLPNPIDLPEREDLLIDPYLFGVWLGDGNSYGGHITKGEQDREWLSPLGNAVPSNSLKGKFGIHVEGLRTKLRNEGVLGYKHVPEKYLFASTEQRLALLQGLMDTDGSATHSGVLEFSNTNVSISNAVEFLLASLGIKFNRAEGIGRLNGVEKKPFVRLQFTAPRSFPVFRLQRKLDRQREVLAEQSTTRNVQYAEPVGFVSAQCLTVEGSMYLAGYEMIPTHNCDRHGGTEETVKGFYEGVEQMKAYIRRHGCDKAVLSELGDGIENFQNTASQSQTNDRQLIEQLDLHTELLTYAVVQISKEVTDLTVVGVPSNHMEVREDGKAVGGVHNDYGLLSLSNVKRALKLNPEAFGHVSFAWPSDHEISLTIDVDGVPVGFAHGHYSRGAGAADGVPKWLTGQFAGNHPLQPAHIIVTAHFHHLRMQNLTGGRWWFQAPTLDRGSSWLEHSNGEGNSQNGILAFTVRDGSWENLELLRTN